MIRNVASVVLFCTVAASGFALPPLDDDRRAKLTQEADRLGVEGTRALEAGRPNEARALLERSLTLHRQLYPAATFPTGHEKIARSLARIAQSYEQSNDRASALKRYQEALVMLEALYPPATHPAGTRLLAMTLVDLGRFHLIARHYTPAKSPLERGVAMLRKQYPREKYPAGSAELALALGLLGDLWRQIGNFPESRRLLEESLDMYRLQFPVSRFPNGHRELAVAMRRLAQLWNAMQSAERELQFYVDALAVMRKLYPTDKFPVGHLDLAASLNEVGEVQMRLNHYAQASSHLEDAIQYCKKAFPPEKFPEGHPFYATVLGNYASLLSRLGKVKESIAVMQQLVQWRRASVDKQPWPIGRTDLILELNNLGTVLGEAGEYVKSRNVLEEALSLNESLYPLKTHPNGHPNLVLALFNLGATYHQSGELHRAIDCFERATAMNRLHILDRFSYASEAEALDHARNKPAMRHLLLSATRGRPEYTLRTYPQVWSEKALVTRALERRHLAARIALANPATHGDVQAKWKELADVRREIHRMTQTSGGDPATALAGLTDRKERLERDLSAALPELARRVEADRTNPADLRRVLPAKSAVIDFVLYAQVEFDPAKPGASGIRAIGAYTVFVLTPGGAVTRVELGSRDPIHAAIKQWRADIANRRENSAAATELRRLVWEPIARVLPPETSVIYLSPDSELARIPWPALPGPAADTVLLEKHAIAVLPNAPFLLQQLTARTGGDLPEQVLAVGEVSYDVAGAMQPGGRFTHLPGTARELSGLALAAQNRSIRVIRGAEADPERVRRELPDASIIHLATHAYFDESVEKNDRNPLARVGLVLAGANQPDRATDRGIISGETLVELSLERTKLAVLSACETGLGEVKAGEGVFGLTRAFHLAGCPNVIASLWSVNDAATAAMMTKFYHSLWHKKMDPLAALRDAQLTIYRHPELIPDLAGERGAPKIREAVTTNVGTAGSGRRADIKLWAAFMLSGAGR